MEEQTLDEGYVDYERESTRVLTESTHAKVLERNAKYRDEHREAIREQQKEYRARNHDKLRAYYLKNREALLERSAKYYAAHRDRLVKRRTERYAARREVELLMAKEYRSKNYEQIKASKKRRKAQTEVKCAGTN